MSVPAFLEHSYNSACEECGLAGFEHKPGCSQAEPEPEPIRYHCFYCGGTFDATAKDIADAHACAADDEGTQGMALTDADAFRDYGRDICDAHLATFHADQAAVREGRPTVLLCRDLSADELQALQASLRGAAA